jgi:hypothetical protein
MNCRSLMHSALFAAACALPAAACTATEPERYTAREASLTENGDSGPAARAWYQTVSGISYEAFRPIGDADRLHHLDVMDYADGDLDLALGTVYVDGPAVNGRGSLGEHVGPGGVIVASAPNPWIDLVVCDGDFYVEGVACQMAARIELTIADAGGGARLVTYRATLSGETEPTVSGSFVAEPDTLHGVP